VSLEKKCGDSKALQCNMSEIGPDEPVQVKLKPISEFYNVTFHKTKFWSCHSQTHLYLYFNLVLTHTKFIKQDSCERMQIKNKK